jgi:hypothetical protein
LSYPDGTRGPLVYGLAALISLKVATMTDPQSLGHVVHIYYDRDKRKKRRFVFLPRPGDTLNLIDDDGYRIILRVDRVWFGEDGDESGDMNVGLQCTPTDD